MLTKDHKPSEENEQKRILEAGGQIYQFDSVPKANQKNRTTVPCTTSPKGGIVGPKRVLPGRLSVSRTFGDPEAKIAALGGKPGVISSVPEIRSFKIAPGHDYIILASDGIYDKLSNKDIIRSVTMTMNDPSSAGKSVHEICGASVESIAKNALMRKSLDNVTVVMLAFKHFKDTVKAKSGTSKTALGGAYKKKPTFLKEDGTAGKKAATESRNAEVVSKKAAKTDIGMSGTELTSPKVVINGKMKASFK